MQFRDSLEEAGGLDRPALEAAVAAKREELLADAERVAASNPGTNLRGSGAGDGERSGGAHLEPRNGRAAGDMRSSGRGVRCGPFFQPGTQQLDVSNRVVIG